MTKAPAFIQPQKAVSISDDKLIALRQCIAEARDIEVEIAHYEEIVATKQKALTELRSKTLPDMMIELKIDNIGLAAEGNYPAYDAELSPFYSANIAVGWTEEERKEGFDYLESIGEGDLIKTEVTVAFPREDRKKALALIKELAEKGLAPSIKQNIPFQTLTAWLKRQVEKKQFTPDLKKIGGTVGLVVRLKPKE